MELIIEIIIFITILICCLYFGTIAMYCYGWIKTESEIIVNTSENVLVSIIIVARNEELYIDKCLYAISKQSYSNNYYEIIVVDDASTDATNERVQLFCSKNANVTLITIQPNETEFGKKNGIKKALQIANGELIVTTDADCEMGRDWLTTIVSFYKQTNAQMIVSPVTFHLEKTIFEKMQSLEFMALMASTGASLFFNKATMCNGANLAYTRKAVEEVNAFEGIENIASGDDVLLMYKIKNKYPHGVKFLKNEEAIVYTKAKATLNDFINQRKRWSSKKFSSLNNETKFISLLVYFSNFLLLFSFLTSIFYNKIVLFNSSVLQISLLLLLLKCILDFMLIYLSSLFFNNKRLLIYFLPEQFIYIVYVVFIGFLGFKKSYNWKGRTINE